MAETQMAPQDVSLALAKHVADTSYEDLPAEAVKATQKSILDILGITLGASGTVPGYRGLVELVKDGNGRQDSTIIGFGGKVPAWMAALVNGAMAHGLDYDDIHSQVVVHPGPNIIPAAFATAERIGKVSGKDFITAVTLGVDIECRMALAITWELDWHLSPVFGPFACAATAGKLLGLGVDKIVNSFGIALYQAAGTTEVNWAIGNDLRGMYHGFTAKAGVLSALMAQMGIDGPGTSLEGRAGLYPVYFRGKYNRNAILADLGKRFEGVNIRFKPWPACGIGFGYIEATLDCVKEHDIHPDDIQQITVFINEQTRSSCEPLAVRRAPTTVLNAKFSLPFTVAIAAARRRVTIADFSPESLGDKQLLALAEKVTYQVDEVLTVAGNRPSIPGVVEISTRGGGKYQKRVDIVYGSPERPMTMDDIVEKFRDCARYSVRPLADSDIQAVIDFVIALPEVPDVAQIVRRLG